MVRRRVDYNSAVHIKEDHRHAHRIRRHDLGKTSFDLVALGERSKVLVRKKFLRTQLLAYTANLPPSLIGLALFTCARTCLRLWKIARDYLRIAGRPARFKVLKTRTPLGQCFQGLASIFVISEHRLESSADLRVKLDKRVQHGLGISQVDSF
jgi:hypothetical protein